MEWLQGWLQVIALLTISPTVPNPSSGIWVGDGDWKTDGRVLSYRATSTFVPEECRRNPDYYLLTPVVVQGGHAISVDGHLLQATNTRAFKKAGNMYNSVVVPCTSILHAKEIEWSVFTATHSMANLKSFPVIVAEVPASRFMESTFILIAFGTLLAIALLSVILFVGKIESRTVVNLFLACIFCATAFFCWVVGEFSISIEPLLLQKVADIALWMGVFFCANTLHLLGQSPVSVNNGVRLFVFFGIVIIFISGNLDQIQLGSNLVIGAQLVFCAGVGLWGLYRIARSHGNTLVFSEWAKIMAALVYSSVGINDLLFFNGSIDSAPLFPVGVFSSVVLVAILVNEKIEETYRERDYLRKNLESEVDVKTAALAAKSSQLEVALTDLKHAQAEMVQSAKLAAVGTLSAGIAHEINNALNYVNGSISPIQNILKKDQITDSDRSKAERMIDLMKEGLGLTFGIIRNLKQQVSNQGLVEDIDPKELVDGVVVLLKNQLGGRVSVKTDIENGVLIHAQRVGLSQILMNLVVNAVDAMEDPQLAPKMSGRAPEITIGVKRASDVVTLSVTDNGPGMSEAVKSRIFEPFFTTKAVGKGTGLGLHIVRSEVQKAGGDIEVTTQEGLGTTFVLRFPVQAEAAA